MTSTKTQLDVTGILRILGIGIPDKPSSEWVSIRCPLPGHDDRHPSFRLHVETGSWKCHSRCGKGNIVELAAKMRSISRKEAFKLLRQKGLVGSASRSTVDIPDRRVGTAEPATKTKTTPPSWPEVDHPLRPTPKRMKSWRKRLLKSREGKAWLRALGISLETAKRFKLGFGVGDVAMGDTWGHIYTSPHLLIPHYKDDILQAVWVYQPYARLKKRPGRKRPRIVMPPTDQPKQLPIRDGMGSHLVGIDHVPTDCDCVLVCEGLKDMLVAWSQGFVAVSGSAGCGTWHSEWSTQLADRRPRQVMVIYDHDRGGKHGAPMVAKSLHQSGLDVAIAYWPANSPEQYDLADWFNKSGRSADELKTTVLAKASPFTLPPDVHEHFEDEQVASFAPKQLAEAFVDRLRSHKRPLHRWREKWYRWDGCQYRTMSEEGVRNMLWRFLPQCYRLVKKNKSAEPEPCFLSPSKELVSNVQHAAAAITELRDTQEQPFWLAGDDKDAPAAITDPSMTITFRNGLLDVNQFLQGQDGFHRPTSRWFSCGVSPYRYDPTARCPQWKRFLKQVWPDDENAIKCLREWMGHLLVDCTRFQKILLLYGPTRSGKGTIARVIKHLLGPELCAWPNMASLQDRFSLDAIHGRRVAIVPDAHLGKKQDAARVMEVLKSISGEDEQRIEGKYRDAFHGRIQARLMLLGNEIPDMPDYAGALAARFIYLRMSISFQDREDKHLVEKLTSEAPGICNWALRGLRRLLNRQRFTEPAGSQETRTLASELGNPVQQFLSERCRVGEDLSVSRQDLFRAYQEWAGASGLEVLQANLFGKRLHALLPRLKVKRPRIGGQPVRCYQGLALAKSTKVTARVRDGS